MRSRGLPAARGLKIESSSKKTLKKKGTKDDKCRGDSVVGAMCSIDTPCCNKKGEPTFCNYGATETEEGVGICELEFACGFENMVVFGDSLSDVGNAMEFFPCTRDGVICPERCSDGPILADYIAEEFGFVLTPSFSGGNNFAFSAATGANCEEEDDPLAPLSCFAGQVTNYLDAGAPSKDDLFFIWFGGNDVRAALSAAVIGKNSALAEPILVGAVTAIVTQIQTLLGAGACNLLVLNTPNVGLAPLVTTLFGPAGAGLAEALSIQFGQALEAALTGVKDSCGHGIKVFDILALMAEVFTDPNFEQANTRDACSNRYIGSCDDPRFEKCFTDKVDSWGGAFCFCTVSIFADTTDDCVFENYVFNDGLHPTTAVHKFLAGKVIDKIKC